MKNLSGIVSFISLEQGDLESYIKWFSKILSTILKKKNSRVLTEHRFDDFVYLSYQVPTQLRLLFAKL